MNKEYEKLIIYFSQEGYKISEEQAKEIYKQQKQHQDSLLNKIAKVMLSYNILDNVLSIINTDRIKLRKEFNNIINSICLYEFTSEKDIMQNTFAEATKQKYYSDAYVMDIGINFKLQKLTDKEIHKVVNETIKNELWSDRLWSNKKELEKTLKVETENFLQGKTSVNKIEKVVKDRFNQNAFNTHRLVQTEVAKCQSAASDLFAKKQGIKQQMFCATLDNKTSNKCRGYDGKIFDIDDNTKPIPPLHPFCRSCLINLPDTDWKPTKRKDNETKEIIDYKTYEEWLNDKEIN